MHAILTPVGTAGDVNPFVIVGRELRRRGHRATLLGPEVFATVAQRAGLEFVSLVSTDEYERATGNAPVWDPHQRPTTFLREVARQFRPGYAAIERVYRPNKTMLIGHSLSFFTRVFEEVHHVPAATMHIAPSMLRSQFEQPALASGLHLSGSPRWLKQAIWWAVDRFAGDPLIVPALNRWRAELGLPQVSRVFKSWVHSPQRVLGLFPEFIGRPQPDWPPQVRLTGFILTDPACSAEPTADAGLEEFLAAGEAPIVFTAGTANHHAYRFFREALNAITAMRRRAVFVTRYHDHLPTSLPATVRHVSYASFITLFPRAAAVVHHGGMGTCAQALAAGVPQLVIPFGFDQPDNARRITLLGVGRALPPSRVTAAQVAAALNQLLSDNGVAVACRRWREKIRPGDGAGRACDLIEEQYDLATRLEPPEP